MLDATFDKSFEALIDINRLWNIYQESLEAMGYTPEYAKSLVDERFSDSPSKREAREEDFLFFIINTISHKMNVMISVEGNTLIK